MFRRIKKYFTFILIAIICLPLFSYAQAGNKEEEVFFVAKKAFEDGYYEASLGLFNRFQKEFPDSSKVSEAELLSGESLFYQNKFNEALSSFEKLLNKPSAVNIKDAVIYWIAETHFKKNDFPKAAETYRMLVSAFPNSSYVPSAVYSLGWSLFEEGKFSEAMEYFKVIEDKYPQEPQVLDASLKSLECLYNLKEYSALREKSKQLIKFFSKDSARRAYLYFYLAEAEYYLDSFNRALEFFGRAVKESSDKKIRSLSHLGAGWAYLKLNEYKKAEAEFSLVNKEGLNRKSLEAWALGRADLCLKQGKLEDARLFFQEAADLSDDKSVKEAALVQIGDIYYDLGDYPKAIGLYKEVLKNFPTGYYKEYVSYRNSVALYAIGLGYFRKEDYESSLKVLLECRRDLKDSVFSPEVSYLLASCHYNLGNFNKAIENFKEVLSRCQDVQLLQKAEYEIADSFYHLGNEKEALYRFNALRSKYAGSNLTAKAVFWLAGYYYQHNEPDISARYFLSLIQDCPGSDLVAEAYYSLGLIFADRGMHKEAALNFRKAADLGRPEIKFISTFALAEALEASGDFNMAIKEYLKASLGSEFKERAFLRIARIYEDKDDFKEALSFYMKAIETGGKANAYARERVSWIESSIKK